MDEFLTIDTPENVVFGYQIAGIGSRFLSALVDTSLIVFLELLVFTTLAFLLGNLAGIDSLLADSASAYALALLLLLAFAFFWGYYVFFELLWNGQSPGKRWVGLRVIRTDGRPVGLSEAAIRNLVRIIDFLPMSYAIGVVTMFLNRQSRRLGDFAAGTLVVLEREEVTLRGLEELHRQRPRPNLLLETQEVNFHGEPLERLEPEHFDLAERYLARRLELHNGDALAQNIAEALLVQMGSERVLRGTDEALALLQYVVTNRPERTR